MQINISLDGHEQAEQLTAIMALCASLGGRVPSVAPVFDGVMVDGQLVKRGVIRATTPTVGPQDGALPPEADDEASAVAHADPGERDSQGLPWDERIHASSKTKNADGSWRQRRGVDAETVKRISEELTARPTPAVADVSGGPAPDAPTASETPAALVASSEPTAPPPPVTAAPPPPPAFRSSPLPAAAPADAVNLFAAFQELNRRVGQVGLVYVDLNEIAQQAGFPDYPAVAKGGAQAVATFTAMAEALGKLPPEAG